MWQQQRRTIRAALWRLPQLHLLGPWGCCAWACVEACLRGAWQLLQRQPLRASCAHAALSMGSCS